MKKRILSTITSSLLLLSGVALAGDKIDESLPTTADGRLSIDVMNGEVKIKTWNKNEVKVVGELDDDAEGYQFESTEDGRVVFRVEMPKRRWGNWDDSGSNLEFWLPENNNLRFEGVNADVDVENVMGGAKVNTVNGNVEAKSLKGRVNLETVNGKIKTSGLEGKIKLNTVNGTIEDRNSSGDVNFETVNGDIESNTTAADIDISNVNGDMDLELSLVKELEISTVNGDIELELSIEERSRVFISTVGGDADIKFNGTLSADFNIEAHSGGDIRNKLTKDKVKRDRYGPGETLEFKVGKGEAEIEIETVGGDITIEQGSKIKLK